jgi:Fe2+ transport system protein FeoA
MELKQLKMTLSLSDLKKNETGQVVCSLAQGVLKHKLISMGFVPGIQIKMVRNAPLRDPIEIAIQNSLVTLRRTEAQLIVVEK